MIKVDTSGLDRMLKGIQRKDMPLAMRNTLRDVMNDTRLRERQEIKRVFKKPTTPVLNGVRVTERPETNKPWGRLGFRDDFGKYGHAVLRAVSPHIPGEPNTRNQKAMASGLTQMGLMKSDEYLVPSRTMKLNKFGNITGNMASKMLNDIGAFRSSSGFTSTTMPGKVKWIWKEVRSRKGKPLKGIWDKAKLQKKRPGALAMMVVKGSPTYAKRFRFREVARSHSEKAKPYFARKTVDYYITKKYGR